MKFQWCGIQFELPNNCLITKNYWGEPLQNPKVRIGRKEVPLMFKQYVKAKYPELLVWGKSETFANGSSASLYVCNADGTELGYSSPISNDLSKFANALQGGRYDGMHDIYEDAENGRTDNGTEIEFYCKYVHYDSKAPFGSWPDVRRMLIDMMEGKYVWGKLDLQQSIEKVKSYKVTDSTIQKALQYI